MTSSNEFSALPSQQNSGLSDLGKQPFFRWRQALAIAILYFVVTLTLALHRYFTFYATYDQGIFNQVFWNGMHGHFFQSSLSSVLSGAVSLDGQIPTVFYHRLGQHFTPALLVWLPIYALVPSAATLVVLQITLITLAGLVLYALARHYLQPALALLILAGYYTCNAVIGPSVSNFHDFCQIPLFVFTLLFALEKRWWWLVWLMAGLILLVRQDAGVGLFGVGVYLATSRRYPRLGLAFCVLSFSYILFATNVLMPMFSNDISQRFMIERFGQFAQGQEASTINILWSMISQPWQVLGQIFNNPLNKIFYLLTQTLSLVFIPLIAPVAWAIAGFPLLQLLLQRGESALALHIRYAMTLVPGLCFGAVLWWSHHPHRFTPRFRRLWIGCMILSVLIAAAYSPHKVLYFAVPDSFRPWVHVSLTRQWNHASHIRSLMQQIPADASVSSTTPIIPHISGRRAILRLPYLQVRNDQQQVGDVDYILADLWQLEQYQVAFSFERGQFQAAISTLDQVIAQKKYGIQGLEDGVILLQKGQPSKSNLIPVWTALRQHYQPILTQIELKQRR